MKFEKVKGAANHHLFRPFKSNGEISHVFWVRMHKTGKGRLEESLKTDLLVEAREKRDVRIAEFLGEKPRRSSKVFLVEEKYPEFLELKKTKAPNTYYSMEVQWRLHLKPFFGGMILDEVTESAWLRYVAEKRKLSPERKFFNDRKYLSMFLNWLHRDGLIQKVHKLEDVDPDVSAGKVYSASEVEELIENAEPTLRLQIKMAVTMGMRHGEIWSLEWSQIDFKKGTIYLPAEKTKIRKARTFAVSRDCLTDLGARHLMSESRWVFPHPNDQSKPHGRDGRKNAWDDVRQATGIDGRFHDLRHTFLTHAFKKSVNPALICEYAGLSLEEATRTYLHFSVDDTRVVADLVRF